VKILVDYQDVSRRFTGVPRATQDDVVSLILAGQEVSLWMSKFEDFRFDLPSTEDRDLAQVPHKVSSIIRSRPPNKKAWISQFIREQAIFDHDVFIASHFPSLGPKNMKRIVRMHDPFHDRSNGLPHFSNLISSPKNEIARFLRNKAYLTVLQSSITVASSEYSANKIREVYGAYPLNIRVVNCAVGFEDKSLGKQRTSNNYFLVVSGMRQRKRPDIAINAWARTFPSHKKSLIVVGQVPHEVLNDFAHKLLDSGHLQIKNSVSSWELSMLQSQALASIFVSEGEGFGRPIAESLLRGKPVIANDLEVFREFDCGYVSYFKLDNTDELEYLIIQHAEPLTQENELDCRKFGSKFSYESIGFKWKQLLDSMLG